MQRTYKFKNISKLTQKRISRKTAIHEAGHAAAIYLGNQQKGLPPSFFKILIHRVNSDVHSFKSIRKPSDRYIAKVCGGRLIRCLPLSHDDIAKELYTNWKHSQQCFFEADIINLLAGPLAEARYVALRDDELINPQLVNVNALHNYGGSYDLEIVSKYLKCFIDSDELRERKMTELFLAAFNFVSEQSNWLAITALADYILAENKYIIECNEIITVLESAKRTTPVMLNENRTFSYAAAV